MCSQSACIIAQRTQQGPADAGLHIGTCFAIACAHKAQEAGCAIPQRPVVLCGP